MRWLLIWRLRKLPRLSMLSQFFTLEIFNPIISSVNGRVTWSGCEKYDFHTFPTFSLDIFSEGKLLLFLLLFLLLKQTMIKYNNVNIF